MGKILDGITKSTGEKGVSITKLSDINKFFEDLYECKYSFLEEFPKNSYGDDCINDECGISETDYIIIKGSIVVPKKIKVDG